MEISNKCGQLELMFEIQDSKLSGHDENAEDKNQNVVCFISYLQIHREQNKNVSALTRLLSEAKKITW